MLTQWHLPPLLTSSESHHCSRMHIPVHSPWLPGYTAVTQPILITLTKTGLFMDRPCIIADLFQKMNNAVAKINSTNYHQ